MEASLDPLTGRSVLVIDDDQPALQGMRRLLEGWGCRALATTSVERALRELGKFGAPDLIIADYRLRRGTGFEAIDLLRRQLGRSVPAVIISGDALLLPQDAGIHVLHKRVHPAKLRSLLSYTVGRGAGSDADQTFQAAELRQSV